MPKLEHYEFSSLRTHITSEAVYQYTAAPALRKHLVAEKTLAALEHPLDFPQVAKAIVPGDRVAFAVDPNVPGIQTLLSAALLHLAAAGADGFDVVLGDEVCTPLHEQIRASLGDKAEIHVHRSDARDDLRYLGADDQADPVYLNRYLVDADFVLPIVSHRSCLLFDGSQFGGVFPMFADSGTRARFDSMQLKGRLATQHRDVSETLGIQVLLSVACDAQGEIGGIQVGTPAALADYWTGQQSPADDSSIPSIVIASLDGGEQQQSWTNAARAALSASQVLENGGTIILWSGIRQTPFGRLVNLADAAEDDELGQDQDESQAAPEDRNADGFPAWDASRQAAAVLGRIASEYRLLLHSELDDDAVEAMGLGVVRSAEELGRLTRSFTACGWLTAASLSSPHGVARVDSEGSLIL